jgi:hypothetical protein
MKDLGDEAEAFFRSGDEGTYEGGPASSIAPFVLCDEPTEDWGLQSADEWLERRRRLKRLVATVVGVGACLMILSVCLLAARARGADDVNPRRQAASLPVATNAPVVAPAPVMPAPVMPAPVVPAPVVPAPVVPAPVAIAQPEEPASAAEAPVVTEPAPSPAVVDRHVDSTRSEAPSSPRRTAFVPMRTKAVRNLPRGSADLPLVSGVVSGPGGPPTAVFSN